MALFSISIPNFNYEDYIPITIESVLGQSCSDLEVLIADNASTDGSIDAIKPYLKDGRVQLQQNKTNVGFFGNLSKVSSMASGEWMNLLSADDLMMPGTLETYQQIIEALGDSAKNTILSSSVCTLDSQGNKTGYNPPDWKLWAGAERSAELSKIAKADVWVIPAKQLLHQSLGTLRTPFTFCTTVYPRSIHDNVEGYCQGGLINPDKRFAWAILAEAESAIIVDAPLFGYRIHDSNQNSIQASTGALKHSVDQYVATFSTNDHILAAANLSKEQLAEAFIEQDIALRGLKSIAEGDRSHAQRLYDFGRATYPDIHRKNPKIWALRSLLKLGWAGTLMADQLKDSALTRWRKQSAPERSQIDAET